MRSIYIILALSALSLAGSAPMNSDQFEICEFFEKAQTLHKEVWSEMFNSFKTMLEKTIAIASSYPEYREDMASMQRYLDRAHTIDAASSVRRKLEYIQGFQASQAITVIDLTTDMAKKLNQPFDDFHSHMLGVFLKFHANLLEISGELRRHVSTETLNEKPELFRLLDKYPTTPRQKTETIGFSILALQPFYRCE